MISILPVLPSQRLRVEEGAAAAAAARMLGCSDGGKQEVNVTDTGMGLKKENTIMMRRNPLV